MTLLFRNRQTIVVDPCADLQTQIDLLETEVADLQAKIDKQSVDLTLAYSDIATLDNTVATLVGYHTRVRNKAALVKASTAGKPVGDPAWKKGVGTMLTVANS